ncbi:MAG: hypothetical protein R3E02_00750 [Blastomonas sp.]
MSTTQSAIPRIAFATAGWLLILISPVIGAIPGPGFIILFPVGLALVLRNSLWARRLYVRFERRFPAYGRWTDWALRRRRQKTRPDLPSAGATLRDIFSRHRKT